MLVVVNGGLLYAHHMTCAQHNNKQQFEAATECLFYAGYMNVAATLDSADLYVQNSSRTR